MATPVFVQALKGRVNINGSDFNVLQGQFSATTQLEDITYTAAGGGQVFATKLPGYASGSGSMQFVYDTANQATVSPFQLFPNQTGVTPIPVIFYPDGTKPFSTSMFVSNFQFSTGPQAGPACKCSVDFETTGTITFPTS